MLYVCIYLTQMYYLREEFILLATSSHSFLTLPYCDVEDEEVAKEAFY
jgi:hypothetical protein